MSETVGHKSGENLAETVQEGDLVTIFRPERFAGIDVDPRPLTECHETIQAFAGTAFGDAAIGKSVGSATHFTDGQGIETTSKIVSIKSSGL